MTAPYKHKDNPASRRWCHYLEVTEDFTVLWASLYHVKSKSGSLGKEWPEAQERCPCSDREKKSISLQNEDLFLHTMENLSSQQLPHGQWFRNIILIKGRPQETLAEHALWAKAWRQEDNPSMRGARDTLPCLQQYLSSCPARSNEDAPALSPTALHLPQNPPFIPNWLARIPASVPDSTAAFLRNLVMTMDNQVFLAKLHLSTFCLLQMT